MSFAQISPTPQSPYIGLPSSWLPQDHCTQCPIPHLPSATTSPLQACPHREGLTPTLNRFSILAELDTTPAAAAAAAAQWSFDFSRPAAAATATAVTAVSPNVNVTRHHHHRRRGKRGGRHARLRSLRKLRKSEGTTTATGMDFLCEKMDALRLDDDNDKKSHTPLQPIITAGPCVDAKRRDREREEDVRHLWMPQIRPNAGSSSPSTTFLNTLSESTAATKYDSTVPPTQSPTSTTPWNFNFAVDTPPLPLPEAIPLPTFKRKESRFFPMSAFLSTPDIPAQSARLSSPPETMANLMAKKDRNTNINTTPFTSSAPTDANTTAILTSKPAISVSPPLTISPNSPPLPPKKEDTVKQDLAHFLTLGHAKDCWCESHAHRQPITSTAVLTPPVTPPPPPVPASPAEKAVHDEAWIPLSPGSLFEEIDPEALTPVTVDDEEDGWAMVSPVARVRSFSSVSLGLGLDMDEDEEYVLFTPTCTDGESGSDTDGGDEDEDEDESDRGRGRTRHRDGGVRLGRLFH